MAKRINWLEVLDLFCWGLDTLGRPSVSRMMYGYDGDRYRELGPGFFRDLIKDDCVTRTGRGSTVKFSITEKGRHRCAQMDPSRHWNRIWDNRWRFFTFDIPETRRKDRLMLWRELRERRVGLLQRSVWVWPHDIEPMLKEMVDAHGIPECFAGFESDRLFLCTNAEVVNTAWSFKDIGDDHEAYLKKIPAITNDLRSAANLEILAKAARQERLAFEGALARDPLLPRTMWPHGYRGESVLRKHQTARAELCRRLPLLVRDQM